MKGSSTTSLLAILATARAYSPLLITSVYTKQPSGEPDGDTNYWNFEIVVNSTNGNSSETAYCGAGWIDNTQSFGDAYSEYVPVGEWHKCSQNSDFGDTLSDISFQLYPYFAVGNFSVALQQTLTQTSNLTYTQVILESDPYTITNTTGELSCTYYSGNPDGIVHASGECLSGPLFGISNSTVFSVPVHVAIGDTTPTTTCNGPGCPLPSSPTFVPAPTTSAPGSNCSSGPDILLSFPVTETTAWYDHVFVVGNISALGDWNVYNADTLNADYYTASNSLWTGGDRRVPSGAGVAFEYKYIQWNADGTLLWECGENRVFTIPEDACGTVTVGNNPDYFRCGNH